jgi:hypothetical protein
MRGQFTSVRFTERLAEIGARPSIGTIADSYDNALLGVERFGGVVAGDHDVVVDHVGLGAVAEALLEFVPGGLTQ